MMMRALTVSLLLLPVLARAGDRAPMVLELFTSEGCASCPPADALVADLLEKQADERLELIVLGFHVDYWNRLGWRDPYSDGRFSERQREYAREIGRGRLYTPQAVINGEAGFVPGEANLRMAFELAAPRPPVRVALEAKVAGGEVVVSLKEPLAGAELAVVENGLSTAVTAGENEGQLLKHPAIVRWLGRMREKELRIPMDPAWKPASLRAVVLVRDAKLRVTHAGSCAVGAQAGQ